MLPRGDTAADIIARLDASLLARGQNVTLRRYTAPSGSPRPKTDLAVRAFVRALKPEEIVGNMDSTFSNVVISPTDTATLLPIVKGDKLVIGGRERNIEFPKPILHADTLVRINLLVAG